MSKFIENPDLEDRLAAIDYAIRNKYMIIFWYRGLDVLSGKKRKDGRKYLQNWRIVEPVSRGLSKKGRHIVRAYQMSGVTNTSRPAWKTFLVSEMSMLKVMDGDKFWARNNRYSAFDRPTGPNFKPNSDATMLNNKPISIIDLGKPKGPNKGIKDGEVQSNQTETIK